MPPKKRPVARKRALKPAAKTSSAPSTGAAAVLEGMRRRAAESERAFTATLMSAGAESDVREFIPCGIGPLDHYVLGGGGLHVGRLTELAGDEATGKTSLMLTFIAGCQRSGGLAALVESEYALESERADVFGVDRDSLVLAQTNSLESVLLLAEDFLASIPEGVGPNLFAFDSVAAASADSELESGIAGKAGMGEVARVMARNLKQLCAKAARKRTALLFVNQTRQKIGVVFGNPTTTTGGVALKFAASVRLQMMGGGAVKDGEQHVGKDVTVLAVKNKLVPPYRKARVRLLYESGWAEPWATLTHAKAHGLIPAKAKGAKALEEALGKLGWPRNTVEQADAPEGDDLEAEDE